MKTKTEFIRIMAVIPTVVFLLSGCGKENVPGTSETLSRQAGQTAVETGISEGNATGTTIGEDKSDKGGSGEGEPEQAAKEKSLINAAGDTLETRVLPPEGYARTDEPEGSLAEFMRGYAMKEDQSPVLLYNGREKNNQSAHQAVFALPMEAEDLQQCADSVMRVYAEYFYRSGQPERIAFHFTNGFLAEYIRWRDGGRIAVEGDRVSWVQSAEYDDSYECFQKYLRMVFCYAGTLSMEAESGETTLSELQVGDVFLKGGSPGHVVMVVDICENEEGRKAFLLGQGYMPAQEFHVLKNPLHEEDPWYYEEEVSYPFQTPEYVFGEGSLRKLQYRENATAG
ncbi:MAG: DUF4846 domain-containing protein [Clostridium sp.]|nr:DUF4846 domain-containing protein [Acetatifactor muris]MCM1562468.1 DUF4846 domain-containing protein [Clostridium sp.]